MKPIRRFRYCKYDVPRLLGYSFVSFWREGSLLWKQIIGKLFIVTATIDCHTTGGALEYVDPDTVLNHPRK
jgi:hypothetical protein